MLTVLRTVLFAIGLLLGPLLSTGLAQTFETRATAAFVYDQTTGTVLLSKNAQSPLPPASMSKLMTIYLAFEAVTEGRLSLDERLPVSDYAASFGGSSMFLNTSDRVTVEDLLRGVIVVSGNDASVVLAEALSPDGTEAGFARMMTARARQLGMMNSSFVNASGWPADGHRMSMQDLTILADRLIADFPGFYPMFAETEFPFDGRVPSNSSNRNPILRMGLGADGLKTGHTQEAGYGLVGSAVQDGRRLIFVITGLTSAQERATESRRIITWAFRQFAQRQVLSAGTKIADAEVWAGAAPSVPLIVPADVTMLIPALQSGDIPAELIFDGPVPAPITAGDPMGELVITLEGLPPRRIPLVAGASVAEGGFGTRLRVGAQVLWRKYGPGAGAAADGT